MTKMKYTTVDLVIFARRTNSRIQESRENYYYNTAPVEKWKFANFKLREESQKQKFKHAKITRSTVFYHFKNIQREGKRECEGQREKFQNC